MKMNKIKKLTLILSALALINISCNAMDQGIELLKTAACATIVISTLGALSDAIYEKGENNNFNFFKIQSFKKQIPTIVFALPLFMYIGTPHAKASELLKPAAYALGITTTLALSTAAVMYYTTKNEKWEYTKKVMATNSTAVFNFSTFMLAPVILSYVMFKNRKI